MKGLNNMSSLQETTVKGDKKMYQYYNPNPVANRTDDCAVRAVAKALNISWEEALDRKSVV